MSKNIFKYKLKVSDIQEIYLPKGAEILSVQVQMGEPVLWAIVDPSLEGEKRTFKTFGTGQPIDEKNMKYLATYQMIEGRLVYHIFEKMQSKTTNNENKD